LTREHLHGPALLDFARKVAIAAHLLDERKRERLARIRRAAEGRRN
jgi:hypothetical protein